MLTVDVVSPADVWGQSIRARLPSADEGAWLQELENTVEEFCKRSGCLVYQVPLTLQVGITKYEINPVATQQNPPTATWNGAHAIYVHYAEFEGDQRRHWPKDWIPRHTFGSYGAPQAIWCPEPAVVEVVPTPRDSDDGKSFVVATGLVPIRPYVTVPKFLPDYYFEAILDGTVGRMMAHIKRPYSDAKMAEYHTRRYRDGMRVAKDEALRRWGNAERSYAYNPSWSYKPKLRHTR